MTRSNDVGSSTHHGVPFDDAWWTRILGGGSANCGTDGSVDAESPPLTADADEDADGVPGEDADADADAPLLADADAVPDCDCTAVAAAPPVLPDGDEASADAFAGARTVPVTITLAVMFGCTAQWYVYVPEYRNL